MLCLRMCHGRFVLGTYCLCRLCCAYNRGGSSNCTVLMATMIQHTRQNWLSKTDGQLKIWQQL